jgi:creatinine amidohydrolase
MLLQHSTWPEVADYLKRSTSIVIPIGSTEQHGPNGLLGTDALCPEIVAYGMSERENILVGPTQAIGMAQHHLGFPGSLTLRPTTLIAVLVDTIESLSRHGFSHVMFLNGHGGNIHTVETAFSEVYARASLGGRSSPMHLRLCNWFQGGRVAEVSRRLFGSADGSHATPAEISLTWYRYPEAKRHTVMEPQIAPDGPFRDAADFRRQFPDGRMGSDPNLASVEHGKALFEAAYEDVMEVWRDWADKV